jgi:acyl dehydratase
MRYLDDFAAGQVFDLGVKTVTAEEIVRFAKDFDPQPFHLDEAAGKRTHFGGLVASGWQTAGFLMRLLVDAVLRESASLGSPGVDEVRWLKPVRPGDTLRGRLECLGVEPSRSKPDRGIARFVYELWNQGGECVFRMKGMGLFARKPGGAAP